MSRGFNLPIWQLEQLRGAQRSERQRILHLAAHSQAAWLTIVMVHLEMIIVLSLFALIVLFLPANILNDFIDTLFTNSSGGADLAWLDYLNYMFYVSVITLLHPFYIAGNFALYINRRTQLEAWDIELDFKKLAIRIKDLFKPVSNTTPLILTCFLVLAGITATPNTSYADENNTNNSVSSSSTDSSTDEKIEFLAEDRQSSEASKKTIKEVMRTKNLNDKKIVKRWSKKEQAKKKKKKKKSEDNDLEVWSSLKDILEPIALFIGVLIEFSLWILIAVGLFLLYYFRDRWLFLLQGQRKIKDEYQAPEVMFGMDVRKESLPDDIISEARTLWQANKHREALSLLYRGALIRLINQEQVKLEDSHTEGDILRHTNKQLSAGKQRYLESLTKQWKLIAYAHRSPVESDMQQLFSHWNTDFAINSASNSTVNTIINNDTKGEQQ